MIGRNNFYFQCLALLGFAFLSSCDSREDYFFENGETPVIDMTTANDTMSSEYWDGKKYRVIEVGIGKPDTLSFSINDPYGKECTYDLKIQSIPSDNDLNGVYAEELITIFGEDVLLLDDKMKALAWPFDDKVSLSKLKLLGKVREFNETPILKITKGKDKIVYSLDLPQDNVSMVHTYLNKLMKNSDEYYKDLAKTSISEEIPFSKEYSVRYALTAKNKIGVESTEYIVVKVKPNRQPVPTFGVSCVDKETNEYKITAGGTDPDGHKIVKWSYVFDYEPFKIGSEPLYLYEDYNYISGIGKGEKYKIFNGCLYYDALECYLQLGGIDSEYVFYYATFGYRKERLAALKKEVEFITPTTRNEVYHVFQSKGEHTISVRCQDELGLWSDYKTEKIYIE